MIALEYESARVWFALEQNLSPSAQGRIACCADKGIQCKGRCEGPAAPGSKCHPAAQLEDPSHSPPFSGLHPGHVHAWRTCDLMRRRQPVRISAVAARRQARLRLLYERSAGDVGSTGGGALVCDISRGEGVDFFRPFVITEASGIRELQHSTFEALRHPGLSGISGIAPPPRT